MSPIKEQLEAYIKILDARESTSERFIEINQRIRELNEEEVYTNKETVATLFYRNIVKYSQGELFGGDFKDKESSAVLDAFRNIRMAYRNETVGTIMSP